MRIVDWHKPRQAARMRAAKGIEYVTFDDISSIPEGDVLLVPASWWYKEKYKKHALAANAFNGLLVMVDYGREFEVKHDNVTGIKPYAVAMMDDSNPNGVRTFPFSLPSFDPHPDYERVEACCIKPLVLVTIGAPDWELTKSLIKYFAEDVSMVWKLRSKHHNGLEIYKKVLPKSTKILAPARKDYNDEISMVEEWASIVNMHVSIGRLSVANQEMVRYGVPTHIWDGKRLDTHKRIELTRKYYEGKPNDYCVQNLIRNIRENIGRDK